jgi:hypothetical protein
MRLRVRSHHFVVDKISSTTIKRVCLVFARGLIQYTLQPKHGQVVRHPHATFAASNPSRSWFRFHINHYKEFMSALHEAQVGESQYRIEYEGYYIPDTVQWTFKSDKQARDYQQDIMDNYLLKDEPRSKLVTFQTGRGKGLTLQLTAMKLKARLLLLVKPMYCEKWEKEMHEVFALGKDDVAVVRGMGPLRTLLAKVQEGKPLPKVIILSLITYQLWLKTYEESEELATMMGFPVAPDELCQYLKIGIRAVDEVHMHFHQVFRSDLYTHVGKSIAMSATLFSPDSFMTMMYETMFPKQDRYKELALIQYIDVTAVLYTYRRPEMIKTSPYGSSFYSSAAVEDSMMKHPPTFNNWLNLITHVIKQGFMAIKREKKRLLIYVYLQSTIALIVSKLIREFPDLDVRPYTAQDPLENILRADITVTTVGSAGTALDVPELTHVILARDIASPQANVQLVGRLRKLHDDHPVHMHYLVATNIETSHKYHLQKIKLFEGRVRSHKTEYYGPHI